jgi:hypothetical protein
MDQLSQLEQQVEQHQRRVRQIDTEYQSILDSRALESKQRQLQEMRSIGQNMESDVAGIRAEMNRIRQATNDRVRVYGDRVPDMLREMDQMVARNMFQGGRPVGPMGTFPISNFSIFTC